MNIWKRLLIMLSLFISAYNFVFVFVGKQCSRLYKPFGYIGFKIGCHSFLDYFTYLARCPKYHDVLYMRFFIFYFFGLILQIIEEKSYFSSHLNLLCKLLCLEIKN